VNSCDHLLRREVRTFNRHCWLGAAGALFFAWLAWLAAFGIYSGMVLLFATVIGGHEARSPQWRLPVFLGMAALTLISAAIDRYIRRYKPPSDRRIIGWHLIPDVVLLPARLTLSVAEHLDTRIRHSAHQRAETARLLEYFAANRRAAWQELGMDFPDASTLRRSLDALQVLGWIDLHRTEDGWIYLLRSIREPDLPAAPTTENT
jgi:hypothetical protein